MDQWEISRGDHRFKGVKLLITGGSSYVGQQLVPAALATGFDVVYTYFLNRPTLPESAEGVALDSKNRAEFESLFERVRPDVVVHLAGSNRSDQMRSVIEEGAKFICEQADRLNCRLIHYSTDVVFDGKAAPYREYDLPNPRHAYGHAKFQAEKMVSSLKNAVIIRPTLIYGLKVLDRSTEWMLAALRKQEPINLFTDQYRNPIWIDSLLDLTFKAIDSSYSGVLHAGGGEVLTRAEFGKKLLRYWGVNDFGKINEVLMPPSAPWPANTTLDTQLTGQLLNIEFPSVEFVLGAHSR
ncbi:MAG: SDR family oxidoreductase [Chloroflexota bacterium]